MTAIAGQRGLASMEARLGCDHHLAQAWSHHCPSCGGTLRRCCDSLLGNFEHDGQCRAVQEAKLLKAVSPIRQIDA